MTRLHPAHPHVQRGVGVRFTRFIHPHHESSEKPMRHWTLPAPCAVTALIAVQTIGLATAPAAGWGYDEHRIVGKIAAHYLSPETRIAIAGLLGVDGSLSGEAFDTALTNALAEATLWADNIKKDDPTYDWAKPLHYVNLPPGETRYIPERDCPSNVCVVEAIRYYADVLQNERAPRPVRYEALKFLVHFVGDIHQPLHAGNAADHGGNKIRLTFFGKETNLHALWDYGLTEHARRQANENWEQSAERIIAELCESTSASGTRDVSSSLRRDQWLLNMDPAVWIVESRTLALAHGYEPVFTAGNDALDRTYYEVNLPVAEERIATAGVRLAALLNSACARERQGLGQASVDDDARGMTADR